MLCRIAVVLVWMTTLTATAFGEPITVVVLPPLETAGPEVTARADVFCAQLAAELAKDAELKVVDRSQVDRVLTERAMGAVAKPALAYDALMRVSIDPLRANPVVILRIVDLSSGNVAGCHEWPWRSEMPASLVRDMAKTCKKSALEALSVSRGRAKVRLLGVSTPRGMSRLEPMRQHLAEMLEEVAGRCPNACVVHHLEALTAKEESLLLLLGQVRLAGGRQFAPQADRLLSTELAEIESTGRTFEDTIIEIRFRLGKSGQDGDWTRVRGKAADWSKLVPRMCELLAEQLGQARPAAAAQIATEMMTRRSQAEAELQAAMQHKDRDDKLDRQRIAAAAKLDPSYEPAAYLLVGCLRWQTEARKDTIREALRYLDRFAQPLKNRRRVIELALHGSRNSRRIRLRQAPVKP